MNKCTPYLGDNKETVLHLLVSYFEKFGSKTCCFEDLTPFISNLDKEDTLEFCKRLRKLSSEKAESVKEIAVQINIVRFERSVGLQAKLNSSDSMALVNKFWRQYEEALPFGKLERIECKSPFSSKTHGVDLHLLLAP